MTGGFETHRRKWSQGPRALSVPSCCAFEEGSGRRERLLGMGSGSLLPPAQGSLWPESLRAAWCSIQSLWGLQAGCWSPRLPCRLH